MRKRRLGRTGLEVSELGLGGLFISSYGSEFRQAKQVIKRALELGVTYIDTAPGYMDSEEVLGKALKDIDAPYVLSTKLGYKPEPFKPLDKRFLYQAFEESLKRLSRNYVDILLIHEPDRPEMMDWWKDKDNYEGPVMDVLNELKANGKIKYLGLGGTTAYEMGHIIDTGKFDVVLTAFNYDLLWREAEYMILPNAKKHNMGIVLGSPLHQGALARKYINDVSNSPKWLSPPRQQQFKRLYELVEDLKMSLPELAIRMVLSNPDISTVLVGAKSVAELEKNIEFAEKGELSNSVLKAIDNIAEMVPFRPYMEPLGLPFNS